MPLVSKTNRAKLVYRLRQDQVAVYTRLKNINPKLGGMLLKPREDVEFIYWELDSKNLNIEKVTPYSQLGDADKVFVHQELDALKLFLQESGDDLKILDIPTLDSIKLLDTNLGPKVVIDSWGYLPFDASKGVSIFTFTPKPINKSGTLNIDFSFYDGSPYSGQPIVVNNNGFPTQHITDADGVLSLGQQVIGSIFQIQIDKRLNETVKVVDANNDYNFTVPHYTEVSVIVKRSESQEAVQNHKVNIKDRNGIYSDFTDEQGLAVFSNVLAGDIIEVFDDNVKVDYAVNKNNNRVELWLENEISSTPPIIEDEPSVDHEKKENNVFFNVLGLDGQKLQDYQLNIQQNNTDTRTDVDTTNTFRRVCKESALNMDMKSTGIVSLMENGEEKIYKCNFKTKSGVHEYTFKIENKKSWLWLLWIIPLLLCLLINFGKDVTLQIQDNQNNAIKNAQVNMSYQYKSLFNFKTFGFLTTESIHVDGNTDSIGLVTFNNNPTTVFDFVFKLRRDAKINIVADDSCYEPTGALIKFYKVFTTHQIKVENKTNDLEINVKEKDSNEPIANANIYLANSGIENKYTTNEGGVLIVSDVIVCSMIDKVYAWKEYTDYGLLTSDTLQNVLVKEKNNQITIYIDEPEPCRDALRKGGVEGDRVLLATPKQDNLYYLIYDFMTIADQMKIYSYPDGKLIHDTGYRSGVGEYRFKPEEVCNGCKAIYMEVQTRDNNTSWRYYFKCENN